MSNWVLIIFMFTVCGEGRSTVHIEQVKFKTELACETAREKISKWEDQKIRSVCVVTWLTTNRKE